MKHIKRTLTAILTSLVITAGNISESAAQLNPLGAQYFHNQYLANPAMAAAEKALIISGSLRQNWSRIPGAPVIQSLTGEYRVGSRVGTGLSIYNEGAGLIKTTRVVGTYSYHLPINEESQQLHFGLSLGFMNERLMNENIDGDQGDISVGRFNRRETYMDGDFGAAYTDNRLNLQLSLPNLKSFFRTDENNTVDRSTFYTSAGYRWGLGEGESAFTVEPKVAFRGIKGYRNILDAGAHASLINDQLLLSAMYHSSKSASFSFGLNYHQFSLIGLYTSETAALRGYTAGNFEIGLKYKVPKKEQ